MLLNPLTAGSLCTQVILACINVKFRQATMTQIRPTRIFKCCTSCTEQSATVTALNFTPLHLLNATAICFRRRFYGLILVFYVRRYITYMPHQFRPSVTSVLCVKTAEHIKILSRSDRPIILVFHHQGSLRKSDAFNPNGSAEYKGGSDFGPMCGYILETVIDRGILTMEDEYKVVRALSNSATFDDLE